jgi:hypothetical protein
MAVLLYADILGMKQRWQRDVAEVLAAYARLERYVAGALRRTGVYAEGAVQSDAVALVFKDAARAVRIGRLLFERCFDDATASERMWLRGVIVMYEGTAATLTSTVPLRAGNAPVTTCQFSPDLLRAVNLEQSFKGPRLLIEDELVTEDLRSATAVRLGGRQFWPFKRLRHSVYPDLHGAFQDVLYLAPNDLDDGGSAAMYRGRDMSRRVRWASHPSTGGSADELAQISALAVAWMETEAIIGDLHRREAARRGQNTEA